MALDVRDADAGALLRVRVKPRASRDLLEGEREGALIVRLSAPPVEGEANVALARFLAGAVDVPPSSVKILRGARGREKLLLFQGLAGDELRRRLESGRSP